MTYMTRQGFCLPSEHGDVQMAGKNLAQEYVSDRKIAYNLPRVNDVALDRRKVLKV